MAPNLMPVVLAPLALLAIWRRTRTHFGRQPVRRARLKARLVFLAVVLGLVSLFGLADVRLLEGLAAGVAGGTLLGLLGLRLTRFERGADGADVYLPNPWVGAAVTLLLVLRLSWRFLVIMPQLQQVPAAPAATGLPVTTPLTLLVLGLMLGYYVCYYAGLLVHHRRFVHRTGTSA